MSPGAGERAPRLHAQHLFPLACFALSVAAFYPGHLSFDSAYQYWQARHGSYENLSPVAMAWAWSAVQSAWPGSGGLLVIHLLLFWAGLWSIACTLFARPLARIAATSAVALASPVLLILSHLWTDAALVACLTAACALILRADRRRTRAPLAFALPLLVYGGLVRHNALPTLLPLFAWAWIAFDRADADPPRRSPAALAGGALLAVVAVFGAGRVLDRALVDAPMPAFGIVQMFDLAALSVARGEMLVPAFAQPPGYTLDALRGKFHRYNNVPLFTAPDDLRDGAAERFTPAEVRELRRAWRDAILRDPRAYLEHRIAVAEWLFGRYRKNRPRALAFVDEIVPFRDNPPLRANDSALHDAAIAWYDRAVGWWIYAPLTHIALAFGCAVMAWRRRDTIAGRCALALAASGLLYVAPLPWIVPAAELRYSGWVFPAAAIALLALLARRAPVGRRD